MLDIPWWYYAIAVVIGAAVWRIWKKPVLGILAAYSFLLLAETVLIRKVSVGTHLQLKLFWSWRVWNVQRQQILTNVLMFIPIGMLDGLIWKWKGLWFAVGLSVVIEVLQLISQRGLCEIDDVIHNCLGAAIGIGLVMLVQRVKEEHR